MKISDNNLFESTMLNNTIKRKLKDFDENFKFRLSKNKVISNINDEKEIFVKDKEVSKHLKKTTEDNKNFINSKLNKDESKVSEIKEVILDLNNENKEIKNKIISIENKIESYLSNQLEQAQLTLKNVYNDLLVLRKNNFKNFDNRVNFYYKSNKSIRKSKKKLYLFMNFLKLKILDRNLIDENQILSNFRSQDKDIIDIGYFLNVEKNIIKPFSIKENLDEVSKTKYFWTNFYEFFSEN